MREKKKIAVFFSSGIGNAVMLVPLLKLLKRNNQNHISIILTSPFITPEFLEFNNFPNDNIIDLRNKKTGLFALKYLNNFDKSYLDYSSSSVKNLFLASIISKKSFAYRKNKVFIPRINYMKPYINIHAVVLHAKMIDQSIGSDNFSLDLMKLNIINPIKEFVYKLKSLNKKIFTVQISSGNNKAKFKNWPIEYWIVFLKKILNTYENIIIVLLGDKNEIKSGKRVTDEINNSNLYNMIGKTSLVEASIILYNSNLYIGLDSAFMHLSVAYNIPSFIILGASSEKFIGYNQFDPGKHAVIYKDLFCRPCHGWIGTNTRRVKSPKDCNDLDCLTELNPEKVFEEFYDYYSKTMEFQNL